MSSRPQPHWKNAVRMPNAAPTASRLQRIALSGTSTERNAASSTTKLSARTTPITSGRREEMIVARSSYAAVMPPT